MLTIRWYELGLALAADRGILRHRAAEGSAIRGALENQCFLKKLAEASTNKIQSILATSR